MVRSTLRLIRWFAVLPLLALPLLIAGGSGAGCCGPVFAGRAHWFADSNHVAYFMAQGGGGIGALNVNDLSSKHEKTILGSVAYAAVSHDGSYVAAVTPATPSGWSLSIVRIVDGFTRIVAPALFLQPVWSPDDTHVVFAGVHGLELVAAADGSPPLAIGLNSSDPPSWAPDSSAFAVSSQTGLWRVQLDGTRQLLAPGPVSHSAWSPGATMVAFLRGDSLRLVAADGTGEKELRAHTVGAVWSPDGTRLAAVMTDRGDLVGGEITTNNNLGELGLVSLDGSAVGLGALADDAEGWSPDGTWIVFAVGNGNGGGLELVRSDGSGHHGLSFGCAPADSRQLIGCTYFGGYTVPLSFARRPLQLRVNNLPSNRTAVRLQLVVRDARRYRVRGASLTITASPARAAVVTPSSTRTLSPGVVPVDVVPHGRLPKNFAIHLAVLDSRRQVVSRAIFGCKELRLARWRGC
jgi:Tol biopolymer transport system component